MKTETIIKPYGVPLTRAHLYVMQAKLKRQLTATERRNAKQRRNR